MWVGMSDLRCALRTPKLATGWRAEAQRPRCSPSTWSGATEDAVVIPETAGVEFSGWAYG